MRKIVMALAVGFAALSTPALAQGFPTKAVTIVVPFSAGGPADIIARILAPPMSKALGQPVVIENTVGAGGTIGTHRVAKAAPDGHTVLLMHTGQATAPALYEKLPFHPVNDFETIGLVTDVAMALVGKAALPVNTLQELVTHLKANPDKLTFGNVGPGSVSHLCGLVFMTATGTKMTTVQYKGGAPALTDLIGGHIDVYCEPANGPTPHIQAGRIKGFAVTTKSRVPTLPNTPTSAEAGVPDFDVTTWYGMYAPRGTPKAAVERIATVLQEALRDPDVIRRFAELSMEPVAQERATPAALRDFLEKEIVRWARILKEAGVQPR